MSWSKKLFKLWLEGDVPELQAYAKRLEAELEHNLRPSRAEKLLGLVGSADAMVVAIQKESTLMVAEDESHGPSISFLNAIRGWRR